MKKNWRIDWRADKNDLTEGCYIVRINLRYLIWKCEEGVQ